MGIVWSDTPTPKDQTNRLELVTLGPAASVHGVITCQKLLGTDTHYLNKRTLPCSHEDCPGCLRHQPKRPEFYVSLYTSKPSKHLLLRLTPGAAHLIVEHCPNREAQRGTWLTVKRRGTKANGSLLVEVGEKLVDYLVLPPEPDLRKCLWHIWGLDDAHLTQEHPEYTNRIKAHFFDPLPNGSHEKSA